MGRVSSSSLDNNEAILTKIDKLLGHRKGHRVVDRKDRRKQERQQKKQSRSRPSLSKRQRQEHYSDSDEEERSPPQKPAKRQKSTKEVSESESEFGPVLEPAPKAKSILKTTKKADVHIPPTRDARSPTPPARVSKAVLDRLQEDDDEIAELEKRLGIKGKKSLPQSFKDDGLDELLMGIDELVGREDEVVSDKKKRKAEADDWLEAKRKKARQAKGKVEESEAEDEDEDEDMDDEDMIDRKSVV